MLSTEVLARACARRPCSCWESRNWYLPKWLGWLPDFHVAGAKRSSKERKDGGGS